MTSEMVGRCRGAWALSVVGLFGLACEAYGVDGMEASEDVPAVPIMEPAVPRPGALSLVDAASGDARATTNPATTNPATTNPAPSAPTSPSPSSTTSETVTPSPPSSGAVDDASVVPALVRDAGAVPQGDDAGLEVWPPEGSPCSQPNVVEERACGICGIQKRLCERMVEGGAVWRPWGACHGEKRDGGAPGTVVRAACSRCGVQETVYDAKCDAKVGPCLAPASAECEAGATEWAEGLSCGRAEGRPRTCRSDCTWSPFGECRVRPPSPTLVAPATAFSAGGGVVEGTFALENSPALTSLTADETAPCPLWAQRSPTSDRVSYVFVEVQNPLDRPILVDLWHTEGDTQLGVYDGRIPSRTWSEDDRRACKRGTFVANRCNPGLWKECQPSPRVYVTAGLPGVEIGPKGSVTVWNALVSNPPSGTAPLVNPGFLTLRVRTAVVR